MRRAGWGRIITVTSIGSRRVFPEYGVVGVSKAAIEAVTRYLAVELAPENIIANCISPGVVVTGALDFFPRREEMIAYAEQHTPAGRLVTPEDVGEVAAWLCSDDAAHDRRSDHRDRRRLQPARHVGCLAGAVGENGEPQRPAAHKAARRRIKASRACIEPQTRR